jgi:hypothetical protein
VETTLTARPSELKAQLLVTIDELFTDNDNPVTVTLRQTEQPRYDSQAVLKQMAEFRKNHPPMKIPADIDINKLIAEMYWEGNH